MKNFGLNKVLFKQVLTVNLESFFEIFFSGEFKIRHFIIMAFIQYVYFYKNEYNKYNIFSTVNF